MKKKTNGTHMRLIIPIKKGIRCCCGCGKIFRFVPMWKIVTSNEYETTFTGAYFLLSHLRNDSPDDNKSLYELPSKELPIEALRTSIKSIDDYLKLPYNIHLFKRMMVLTVFMYTEFRNFLDARHRLKV